MMKDSSVKRQVKKASSSWLSDNLKGSEGSNSTGNSTNSGMLDSDEKMRERGFSGESPKNCTEAMLERWLKSNQNIPILD